MRSASLRFSFLGHGPQLIACIERALERGHRVVSIGSDCPQVGAFSVRHGLACAPLGDDSLRFFAREPYDYLLSVVHHAIVGPELLSTAGLDAINYHDSVLPDLAGFNATAHALLEGRTQHGVTWHRMRAEVDRGEVLLQHRFEIGVEDTAFTLSLKCSQACIESFSELLARLEQGRPQGEQQVGAGSFHLRSERPSVALLDLTLPRALLQRQVRALDFGTDDNWMALPKLWLGERAVTVAEARLDARTAHAPGTVIAREDGALTLATQDGALTFAGLRELEGNALSASALHDVNQGAQLQPFPSDRALAIAAFDAEVTRHERFWVKRLARSTAPRLPQFNEQGSDRCEVRTRAWSEAFISTGERDATATTALSALLVRCGEDEAFDLALLRTLDTTLQAFYLELTPIHIDQDVRKRPFAGVRDFIAGELAEQARRRTCARDVFQRYRELRNRPRAALPIALRLDGISRPAPEAALTLSFGDQGHSWIFDPARVPTTWVERMIARYELLLAHARRNPETLLSSLPLLPSDELTSLLERWQDTRVALPASSTVQAAFAAQVARTPDAIALRFRAEALRYRELDQRANRVAHALRARGVGPDVLVGLCIERSLEMVIGLLAILKAGGAYVPIDPVYPRERIAIMLEDAKAKLLLTDARLEAQLPGQHKVAIETLLADTTLPDHAPEAGTSAEHLAYVIFTSGSTGRPKGVMVQHGNVINFFAGMDRALSHEQPGRWLAVTSISFDISVLELFWTLSRGFEVVLQGELDRTSLAKAPPRSAARMGFSLFYFAASTGDAQQGGVYRLLLEGARFADQHGFDAVWTPERHFHEFGGLYPNPAVTTAALATITSRVQLRAGSIVLPLHNPLRVAEDWAVIDNLSGGRVGMSFASGWHVNDFAFMPQNYERRREVMLEGIETVRKLWRGEKIGVTNGAGKPIEVSVLPRPLNPNPPVWVASAGNVETFELAGRQGFNVLTNMLGQDLDDLRTKLQAYRNARAAAGHSGPGAVTVMLHTFVCEDTEKARELARKPFSRYLASSFDLVKVAPWMFPAFKQPSRAAAQDPSFDPASFTEEDMAALLEHAFDRYFETAGLFGSPAHALKMVERLKGIGVDEVACLIDFGIDSDEALRGLTHLDRLRELSNTPSTGEEDYGVASQLVRHGITHLQCTPSMARMLLSDPDAREALRGVRKLMLGGEALPRDLADQLLALVGGDVLNMYGPTETTVWSTTSRVDASPITIGQPIANTVIRILDAQYQLAPIGVPGELCIGGAGVVRGYLARPDLTNERFIEDPFAPGKRLYRTGDLARYRDDGAIEFLGRLDHQVKISGYRIELGEIENVLARHPAVRQSVVVARNDRGNSELVAYVVAQPGADESTRVDQWRSLWDEAYKLAGDQASARFNIAGWRDSFTGAPIPAPEMREWLDATLERVLAGAPRRVLEIGCGTGMILYGALSRVEHYTAVDVSPHALDTIRRELSAGELAKVTLINQAAHQLSGLAPRSYDAVIINSVAQYFPDAAYLRDVLRRASELVADGGRIVIGDVRDANHLRAFHARIELTQAPAERSAAELAARIERRIEREGELLLNEAWFRALPAELPRITAVDVQLKRGAARNEMSCFRLDVVLSVGASVPRFALPPAGELALQHRPEVIYVRDLPNARLTGIYAALDELAHGRGDAGSLRAQSTDDGVDPESLYTLDPAYEAWLVPARSGDPARFDAVLRQRGLGGLPDWPTPAQAAHANQPARASGGDELERELRELLRGALPAYMVPAHFVQLDALPLTPNQKIDRKALPPPLRAATRAPVEHAQASNELERKIEGVWQAVLNVERVGRSENIFELGANSLLTVQAANRLGSVLGRKVSLVSMFRFPSVAALAAHLAESEQPQLASEPQVEERGDRRKDAAERRRQLRAERAAQGVKDD